MASFNIEIWHQLGRKQSNPGAEFIQLNKVVKKESVNVFKSLLASDDSASRSPLIAWF